MDNRRKENLFFLFTVLAVTVIAYAPMVDGILRFSVRTTQAVNAFVLVAVAFADAFATVIRRHAFRVRINNHGLFLFTLSCVALASASVSWLWPLAVLALCLNLVALLSFCFGREGAREFTPAVAGLGIGVGMLIFVPRLDAALRMAAAKVSAWALAEAGFRAELAVREMPFRVVMLVERGAAGLYDVATECNGFGILLSCVVLTVIVALRRRAPAAVFAALLGFSLVAGLVFNSLRIVAIVMASVRTDMDYDAIHEGLGSVVYLLALGLVYAVTLAATRARTGAAGPDRGSEVILPR